MKLKEKMLIEKSVKFILALILVVFSGCSAMQRKTDDDKTIHCGNICFGNKKVDSRELWDCGCIRMN